MTSLASDSFGRSLLIAGCGDGTVRLFDRRLAPSEWWEIHFTHEMTGFVKTLVISTMKIHGTCVWIYTKMKDILFHLKDIILIKIFAWWENYQYFNALKTFTWFFFKIHKYWKLEYQFVLHVYTSTGNSVMLKTNVPVQYIQVQVVVLYLNKCTDTYICRYSCNCLLSVSIYCTHSFMIKWFIVSCFKKFRAQGNI